MVVGTIPFPRPIFVGPIQTKGYVDVWIGKQRFQWGVEDTFTAEPIIMNAEAIHTAASCECSLATQRLGIAKIIKP